MPRRRLRSYLRSARLSAGLSQAALGALIGVSDDVIGNCERGRTSPTFAVVVGCTLLFGKSAVELFPEMYRAAQEKIGRRAAALDEKLRHRTDATSAKKLLLLRAMAERTIAFPDL